MTIRKHKTNKLIVTFSFVYMALKLKNLLSLLLLMSSPRKGQTCHACQRRSVCRPSVVRPVVTCLKLSKTDTQLLWNTIIEVRTADSVAAFRRFSGETFWFQIKICSHINTASRSTVASDHKCYQQSATVGTCC